ncbi:MAG TPA: metallophosphoesterase [Anaerolineae bacterium]|jgi:UDP-2,3-diacylglucosamine pyrophosphatase LpxH|nr:metallophosphoesterase [Anaerolineae bacterium]
MMASQKLRGRYLDPFLDRYGRLPTLKEIDHARVARAMDAALARIVAAGDVIQVDVQTDQFVVFSDQHKGSRDGADDFSAAEQTYNRAIAYYNRMGYTLLTLGDVEELWEDRPRPVIQAYPNTFALEAQFHAEGRYQRIWGNHDDDWRYSKQVEQYLAPVYGGAPLNVREGLLVNLRNGTEQLGRLLLVHGHQGTLKSDYFADFSRNMVRYLWRPFQRLTRIPSNTPATNWRLRHSHNIAMYSWSAQQDKMLLIAGHTHRPVFESVVDDKQLQAEITAARVMLKKAPADQALKRVLGELEEELAWVQRAVRGQFALEQASHPLKPSYYNTGCCCYPDGSITGVEMVAGEIRLARWNKGDKEALREVLARASLEDVFAAC